jgi:DinB superfamily
MYSTSNHLAEIIASAYTRLMAISEEHASAKPVSEKWSFKEILGHLIDSASNNHQRFVRMQEAPHIGTFRYSQKDWVNSQRYDSEPWKELVELWFRYNRHLVHVIAHINPETLMHVCDVGDPEPATLKLVVEDYVRHVEHHLRQILSGVDPRHREQWK